MCEQSSHPGGVWGRELGDGRGGGVGTGTAETTEFGRVCLRSKTGRESLGKGSMGIAGRVHGGGRASVGSSSAPGRARLPGGRRNKSKAAGQPRARGLPTEPHRRIRIPEAPPWQPGKVDGGGRPGTASPVRKVPSGEGGTRAREPESRAGTPHSGRGPGRKRGSHRPDLDPRS